MPRRRPLLSRPALFTSILLALLTVPACDDGDGSGADAAPDVVARDAPADLAAEAPDLAPALDGADAGDAATDDPIDVSPRDAGDGPPEASPADTAGDMVPRGPCRSHLDCATLPAPPALRFCSGGAWSCAIPAAGQPGHCIRECYSPGRTCSVDTNSCIGCSVPVAPTCPGAPCRLFARAITVEDTTCPTAPLFRADQCRGDWLIRDDGALCSITELATGAVRFAVACPDCTTIIVRQ